VFNVTLLLIITAAAPTSAGDVDVDSLKATLIVLSLDDEARIGPLIELANFYLFIDPRKAAHHATQVSAFSNLNDFNKAKAFRLLGQAEMYQGLNKEAFVHLNQAITRKSVKQSVAYQ
jgi:hypothetical protein